MHLELESQPQEHPKPGSVLRRWWTHVWVTTRHVSRYLSPQQRQALEERIRQSEIRHLGELRVCIEARLPSEALWRGETARQRASQLFSMLGVWNTEHNNGVLIYMLLAERRIEVLADRGLMQKLGSDAALKTLVDMLVPDLQNHCMDVALNKAIDQVGALLTTHFPAREGQSNTNELSDAIVVL